MAPKLFVLTGPAKGTIAELPEGELSVGRGSGNSLYVPDALLSRRHCVFIRSADQVTIRDEHSLNGTFVDGVPVNARELEDGDQVQIGDSVLFLSLKGLDTEVAASAAVQDHPTTAASTIEFPQENALSIRVLADETPMPPTSRSAALAALVRLSAALMALREPHDVEQRLLDLLLESVPADRAVLLVVSSSGDLETAAVRGHSLEPTPVDFAVARRCLRERLAVAMNDVSTPGVRAAMCAPLVVHDQPLGVVYFTRAAERFGDSHLQFLTPAAALAGMALENVRHFHQAEHEGRSLLNVRESLIGESEPMRRVLQFIGQVAPADSTVLLMGETGTGKELVARAVHARSTRAGRPFAAINCATLSDPLLESTLFGHERGAFTGAVTTKRGILEVASGGTVFLDEVGELSPLVQGRLLRVIQEREFERVGGTVAIKVDIRLIAATNRDLKRAVADRTFRQDLFFRLNVIAFSMPPLRDRREDIELLARYFVRKYARRCRRRMAGVSQEALQALESYQWPGNVRELENAIERAVVMSSTDHVLMEDLPGDVVEGTASDDSPGLHGSLITAKKELIRSALDQAGGDYARAAHQLGIHVNSLHRMIAQLGIRRPVRGAHD